MASLDSALLHSVLIYFQLLSNDEVKPGRIQPSNMWECIRLSHVILGRTCGSHLGGWDAVDFLPATEVTMRHNVG